MFQLTAQRAELAHMSMYREIHGDEHENGVALKFVFHKDASVLEQFDAGLFHVCYGSSAMGLKFPDMGPIKWKRELVGATVTVDGDDLLGERHVTFSLATVDKFIVIPLEGGSVNVTLRCKVKPDADQMAALYEMLSSEVLLTIDPAKAEDQPAKDEQQAELEGVDG